MADRSASQVCGNTLLVLERLWGNNVYTSGERRGKPETKKKFTSLETHLGHRASHTHTHTHTEAESHTQTR